MKRTRYAVGLAALCLSGPIQAIADVQVSYTVEEKALKSAVTGTSLTFTVYSDSGCTMQLANPVAVPIDDVALIERLRRFKPKHGTKPPTTDRLTHVLTG